MAPMDVDSPHEEERRTSVHPVRVCMCVFARVCVLLSPVNSMRCSNHTLSHIQCSLCILYY